MVMIGTQVKTYGSDSSMTDVTPIHPRLSSGNTIIMGKAFSLAYLHIFTHIPHIHHDIYTVSSQISYDQRNTI